MKNQRPWIKITLGAVFALALLGYAFAKTENLVRGPALFIAAPAAGADFTEPLIELKGRAERIAALFLNGGKIFTDENGWFREKLLLAEGHNIIRLEAADQFGRKIEKTLSLVFQPLPWREDAAASPDRSVGANINNDDQKDEGGAADRRRPPGND